MTLCANLKKVIFQLFSSFFINKIYVTYYTKKTQSINYSHHMLHLYPSIITTLSSCIHPTTQDIEKIILFSKSSSPLDPIPLSLMKKVSPLLEKYFYEIIYTSFMKAHVPSILKHAFFIPILKKSNIDDNSLCNYRPISQPKIIERVLNNLLIILMITILLIPIRFRTDHFTVMKPC